MDGLRIIVDGLSLPEDALQLPTIDAINPSGVGALLLIDPAHPLTPWSVGIPATVPNLFADVLDTGAICTLTVGGDINDGVKGKVERTTRGALHVIVSKAETLAAGDGVKIVPPADLVTYINANDDHDYYIEVWRRVTRATGADDSQYLNLSGAYANGDGLGSVHSSFWQGSFELGAVADVPSRTVGAYCTYKGQSGVGSPIGTWPGEVAVMLAGAAPETINASLIATMNGDWESTVFMRVYIEDLTVSGRTYEEVSATGQALFSAAVLTSGGRYYGDGWTDPDTIP